MFDILDSGGVESTLGTLNYEGIVYVLDPMLIVHFISNSNEFYHNFD